MTHARLAPGLRRLPIQALVAHAQTERCLGRKAARTPGQCLAAFKRAATPLGLAACRDLLDQLMAFTQPQDWREGARPIVWPSNAVLQDRLGISERHVRRLLGRLIEFGVIVAVDSPQGRRWGRRDAQGRIVEAFGFDLSPLADRHLEFLAIAEKAEGERKARAVLRRRLTIARKAIQQLAETALEHALGDRDWCAWLAEARVVTADATGDEVPLTVLRLAVSDLEHRCWEGETALVEALRKPVEESGSPDSQVRPTTTTTQPPSLQKGNKDRQGKGNGPGAPASPTGTGPEDDDPEDEPPVPTPAFVLRVSPPLKRWLRSARPSWPEVVEAADRLRRELGVSQAAWTEACRVLGRHGAATAVAIIAAKRAEIRSPGGYLRAMTARAERGELYLVRSLYGLGEREGGVA